MKALSAFLVPAATLAAECFYDWTVRDHVVDYMHPQMSLEENLPVPPENRMPGQMINRQYPGPAIECNEGDDVVIVMRNELLDQGVSVHWHGLYMAGGLNGEDSTPWADGVHRVTQAPIMPGQNYTYRFKAYPPGSHFYHSHMDALQVDRGIKGPIIIHAKNDPHRHLYDEERIIALSDARRVPDVCLKLEGQEVDVGNPVCNEIDKTSWNGRYGNGSKEYPYPLIEVEQGKCYRFRWIAMAGNTQNYKLNISGHNQTVIALDSYDIKPYPVQGFNLHNGERVDTIFCADQEPGNYLINATYDLACELVNDPVFSPLPPVDSCLFYAFIHYKGHNEIPKNINSSIPGGWPQGTGGGLNPRNLTGNFLDLNTIGGYQAVENVVSTETPVKPDYTFTLIGGILGPTPTHDMITEDPLSGTGRTYLNMQNGNDPGAWSWSPHNPSDPLLHTKGQCGTNGAPILNIPEDAEVVEIVLINTTPSAHVFHMHGMPFDVINYGWPEWCDYEHHDPCFFMPPQKGKEVCKGELTWADPDHKPMGGYLYWGCAYNASAPEHTKTLNYKTPLRKDMLSLWRRQWAVIRIYPKNPGMWVLHCHMEQHIPTGMMIALNVLPSKQKPIPGDVPTSGKCPKNIEGSKEVKTVSSANATKLQLATNDWIVDYQRPTAVNKLRKWPVGIDEDKRQAAILANGNFPAEPIVVNEGDDMEITVDNRCLSDLITLHWHGISQAATPWYDGSNGITQSCVKPQNQFTYKFKATPAGTHYFHSQTDGLQSARGLKGAFIVKNPTDPHQKLYSDEIVMTLSDAWQEPENCLNRAVADYTNNPECAPIQKATFNGQYGDGSKTYPYKLYPVTKDTCYRLRVVGMMSQVPSFTLSIESHAMTVIAVDGSDVQPKEVSSITVYAGERYDVVVCAKENKGNYLVTATYEGGCDKAVQALHGSPAPETCSFYSFLQYTGAETPKGYPPKGTGGGLIPKPLKQPALDLGSAAGYKLLTPLTPKAVPAIASNQYTLNLGSLASGVNGSMYLHTSRSTWVQPSSPLLETKGLCGASNTPVINVPEAATSVELVINNLSPEQQQVHLHGARFSVVNYADQGWCSGSNLDSCLSMTATAGKAVCDNIVLSDPAAPSMATWWGCAYTEKSKSSQNLVTPLAKDTLTLPPRGWVVLRVETTTPGFWMLQTMSVTSQLRGAQTVLNVLPSKQVPVPADVPMDGTCKRAM